MAIFQADINGRHVLANTASQYDGFGYTPTVALGGRLVRVGVQQGMTKKAADDECAKWIESLGFRKEQPDA